MDIYIYIWKVISNSMVPGGSSHHQEIKLVTLDSTQLICQVWAPRTLPLSAPNPDYQHLGGCGFGTDWGVRKVEKNDL